MDRSVVAALPNTTPRLEFKSSTNDSALPLRAYMVSPQQGGEEFRPANNVKLLFCSTRISRFSLSQGSLNKLSGEYIEGQARESLLCFPRYEHSLRRAETRRNEITVTALSLIRLLTKEAHALRTA